MGLPDHCEWALTARYPKGPRNQITDVPGVLVGHTTLRDETGNIHTGVTAILPHGGNLFYRKVMAGCCVINGFGKSAGLIQVEELGTIESPILMTNTLSVGTALTALDRVFDATAETVEEAVISSLYHAHSVTGIHGRTVPCLRDCIRRKS